MACARTASKDNDDYCYNEDNNDDEDSNGGSNRGTFDNNS